jgi:integrase
MELPDSALEFLFTLVGKSKNTKKVYEIILRKFFSYVNKSDINEIDVIRFLNFLEKKGYKISSLRIYAIVLRKYLKFLSKDYKKVTLPPLRNEQKNIYIKKEDLRKFIESFENIRDKLLVRFILLTGCRVGEVANLHIEDIDFDKRIIKIVDHGKYEIKKPRIIPIDSETLKMLKEFIGDRKSGPVFNISPRAIQKIIKKGALKSGIPYASLITPHKLRHTMAIYFITEGGDIRSLQRILGHNSLRTTEIYLDYDLSDLIKVYDRVAERLKF